VWHLTSSSTTADAKTLKFLNVVDEFTREALVTHVDRSIIGGCPDGTSRLGACWAQTTSSRQESAWFSLRALVDSGG
jgi:hypothetical protein